MRARNWAEERRARELRKLLNEVDPPKRVFREESYLRIDPVAKPRTFNHVVDGQGYVPEKPVATRPGADSHRQYKSRGM
jgi:hypothetical protein